jgi:hypothetical protein
MFVLLEAVGDGDETPLDVVAVAPSEDELGRYLAAYWPRYEAACREFDAWDSGLAKEWGPEHGFVLEDVARKHGVHGSLIEGARFEILESRVTGKLVSPQAA